MFTAKLSSKYSAGIRGLESATLIKPNILQMKLIATNQATQCRFKSSPIITMTKDYEPEESKRVKLFLKEHPTLDADFRHDVITLCAMAEVKSIKIEWLEFRLAEALK